MRARTCSDATGCRRAKIPDNLVYRPKYEIALEQLDRAVAGGVRFAWITADEWYAQKPALVQGLEARGLRFVYRVTSDRLTHPTTPSQPKTAPLTPVP